ncbi:MAG: ABC transporter ATP-binding protein [Alphaproteobacteria bacterium]|nr:ABC transporter ATP-binding protein [Alphaproteobacteria bacterium]
MTVLGPAPVPARAAEGEAPLLEAANLTVRFGSPAGEVHAVEDVSLRVAPHESVGIVGESGSGKTVTCMSMTWLLPSPPARYVGGHIRFKGEELRRNDEAQMRRIRGRGIGMIFQNARLSFNPAYRLGAQIAEVLRMHFRTPWRAQLPRVLETLRYCNIADAEGVLQRYPHEVSGGVAQRVSIALALLIRPDLLIADEPTTSLDLLSQIEVLGLLERLRAETGLALVLVSHDLNVVRRIAERVVIMYAGRIVEEGPAHEIFAAPRHPYTQGLLASALQRTEGGRLYELPGTPPDLAALPPGCSFRARCAHAFAPCTSMPPLLPAGAGHAARCHLLAREAADG